MVKAIKAASSGTLAVLFVGISLFQVDIIAVWIPQWGKTAQLVMLQETEDAAKDTMPDEKSKAVDLAWDDRRHTFQDHFLQIAFPACLSAGQVINFPSDKATPPPEA